ncbi:glycoside hydrolase family 88 protein [bacterium]|nr:glycoside hydrolase family 88 protein [bacterium]
MKKNKHKIVSILIFTFSIISSLYAQMEYAQKVIESQMKRTSARELGRWVYITGFYMSAQYRIYKETGNPAYLQYIKDWIDDHVNADGVIDRDIWSLDNCQPGLAALYLYQETGERKYKAAADHIRETLRTFPRTSDGGFHHDTAKRGQLWLDGVYMALPFLVTYGRTFGDTACYTEAANQICIYASHLEDEETGLLFHAYDEDGSEDWADNDAHRSHCFWGRSMGWFGMAIVDILDVIPSDHPRRPQLIQILSDLIGGFARFQDTETGLWYQLVNRPEDPDNWLETSCSCMVVYFTARAMEKGYIPDSYLQMAIRGYEGILKHKLAFDEMGMADLKDVTQGTMVRNDCAYYLHRPRRVNDLHGLGAFVTMCWQMARMNPDRPTLYVAGNSTAKNGDEYGWGSHLQKFFDPGKLTVKNRARGGRSSRTFITEGLWDAIRDSLKAGDYVIIEFGHNDAGQINDERRARGSIPTNGDETQEIDNMMTGKHETVHTFGWYMRKMINETRAKGAVPIVMSMTARNVWPDGKMERENTFCTLAKELAVENGVPFIDLRNMIADQYELLGPVRVRQLFPRDHTHTGTDGAFINAAMVVSGLRAIGSPLAGLLSDLGESVTPYGPDVFVEQVRQWMTSTWMPEAQPQSDSTKNTLIAIGNSTVRTGRLGNGANGQWGWGAPIADFFDRTRLNVENKAMGGTSSRTFRSLGLWQPVLDRLKPGDYVIMQFGHNDSSPVNDERRARGTINGNGEETEEIDNLLTGERETVHSYGWYIRQYIKEIKAKNAVPIVCSLIPRNRWTDGKINRSVDSYAQWAEQAARQEEAVFVDLNTLICDHYDEIGQERVTALYFDGNETTHTNAAGAQMNAGCLVKGLKAVKDFSLNQYFKVVEPQ